MFKRRSYSSALYKLISEAVKIIDNVSKLIKLKDIISKFIKIINKFIFLTIKVIKRKQLPLFNIEHNLVHLKCYREKFQWENS